MVLLADRGVTAFALWRQAAVTGIDLLWRAKNNVTPRQIEVLADGSWLGEMRLANTSANTEHVVVRVVDYTVDDGRYVETGPFRLFTTMLDPTDVTATELAAAYAQRWEIETIFDELKTHQRGSKMVLRSKSPTLVLQEIWGHLCCHYAIRTLRRCPSHRPLTTDNVTSSLSSANDSTLHPVRRGRARPRLIKRKMAKWDVKRARHHDWPNPADPPAEATICPPN